VTEERAEKGKDHDGITVLEALAATGLRSVRYAKEIPSIKKLVANDILPAATDLMKKNFEFNDCDKDKIEVHTADAIDLMHGMRAQKKFFNVVDLDPYGTAIPFLESAISCIANNGLLCVTFTDMAVLCARQPHVCFYKMGASPLGKSYCHEMALRIVLFTINSMANKHGK
jgi:tRNA (guanine26-N2/guanine27-N2)-dimethyltransferase